MPAATKSRSTTTTSKGLCRRAEPAGAVSGTAPGVFTGAVARFCQAAPVEPEDGTERVELDALGLTHGDATALDVTVSPGEVILGGQGYRAVPAEPVARLDVSRTTSGYALRLRLEVAMEGPCFRCLEPASSPVAVDAREVDQPVEGVGAEVPGRRPGVHEEDENPETAAAAELTSPYVESGQLDISSWARDALILALPNQILCRDDCPGLCSSCGEPLKGADPEAHVHGQDIDPRWAKLRDLG